MPAISAINAKVRVRFPHRGRPFVFLNGEDITQQLTTDGLRIEVDDSGEHGDWPVPVVHLTFAAPDLEIKASSARVVEHRG